MQRSVSDTHLPAGLLPALAFANFAIGIGAFVVIGVLTPIAEGLRLTHAEAGLVMSIYAAAYAIGSPLAITATGRLDRRSVILMGMGVFLVATLLCAIAPNATTLLAARALGALGAGMVSPVSAAIAAAKSPPEHRGAALSFVILGLTLAQVAGIPIGSFLGYTAGWRATFWMVAAITVLALLGILWRVPRIRTPVNTLASLGRTLASPVLMPAILVTASVMGAAWILFTYFAPLLEERMGYGRNGVTFILVVFGAGAVIGNMLGGWLSDRIGPARSLVFSAVLLILLLPFFSLLPMPGVALATLTFVWGIVGWAFMAPQQSRIIALAPENQNVSLSLNASAIYVGAAIGSAAGGAIIEGPGIGALGWASALAMIAVLGHILLTLWLNWRQSRIAAGFGIAE
jgi:MFS transporter, DHA1 family, inner membrane transport protein